jgi:integrase
MWGDLDLDRGLLSVRRALQRMDGRVGFVEPKSARSRRTLAIPAFARDILSHHREWQAREREAAGDAWQGSMDLVFCTVNGMPLDGAAVTHQFHRMLARAGVPRRRFHDLRHSCATVLAAQGVPARVVMELLGHSQISLTMNTYSHVLPDMQREAAEHMDGFIRGIDRRDKAARAADGEPPNPP